ncbi:MAG TPA: hypothetical protein VFZ75_12085 [Actinomycetota bacterium]|nr:hypothetical protein [Actinomycetota bacterium]
MKKRVIVTVASAMLMLGLTGTAQAAPGADIRDACGASFGALVSSARSSGTAAHGSYAGGANAFSNPAILAAHGCAV